MIVVRLQGGLGNQMFQYASSLRLAMKHRTELRLDLATLLDRTPRENMVFRDYDLELFRIPEQIATSREARKYLRRLAPGSRTLLERIEDKLVKRSLFQEQTYKFDPQILALPDETYLDGYFQSEQYFADIEDTIRERYRFPVADFDLPDPTRSLAEEIHSAGSVCMNVRRGDFVSNPKSANYHGVCGLDYFERSAAWMAERVSAPRFFVFSDDPDWCRENIRLSHDVTFVGPEHNGPRFFHMFWLMSRCSHFIIPNSSFGWWAAWLAVHPGKQVVCPAQWFRAPEVRDVDICPASWTRLPNS